jgi:iodotyrosine deiodinase
MFRQGTSMAEHAALPWQHLPEMTDPARIARAQDFLAEMANRHSCRSFSDRPVPREIIETALRAASSAPSGANRQPWHFCVIEAAEAKAAIRIAVEEEESRFYGGGAPESWLRAVQPLGTGADKPYLETAPWLIAVFAQRHGGHDEDRRRNYYVVESVCIAVGMLLATLQTAGIATLVHTPHPMRFLNRVCRRPESERPLMLIVAGHAAADATVPADAFHKKPLEAISSWL